MESVKLQPLPLGNSGFEMIRSKGKLYVDKTGYIAKLVSEGDRFFLSRPRRFGKSLMVTTLESLFKNGLQYFKGLAIEKDWTDTTYPVVHIDFSEIKKFKDFDEFEKKCGDLLSDAFEPVGFERDLSSPSTLVSQLSKWLKRQAPSSVVLLVDEYDSALSQCLNNPELFEEIQDYLSEFYASLRLMTQSGDSFSSPASRSLPR